MTFSIIYVTLVAGELSMDNFIITKFYNCINVLDSKGRKLEMKDRYASCFILPLKGSIRFSFEKKYIISDKYHPVFLPKGFSYTNECIESAESIVFNFRTQEQYTEPTVLSPISPLLARQTYDNVLNADLSTVPQKNLLIMSELYTLSYNLFTQKHHNPHIDEITEQAMEYINKNYFRPDLNASEIANACFISEIYLRKLFNKKYNSTPFKRLTAIRMKKARSLALEKRPVKEIALSVGYSDVSQFSRAYKRYFGYSPSET